MITEESAVSCGVFQLFKLAGAVKAVAGGRSYSRWDHTIGKLNEKLDNAKYGSPAYNKAYAAVNKHYGKEPANPGVYLEGGRIYLFSDADKVGNGKKLAAYIKKSKLGKVVSTGPVKNPESGNVIRTWLWIYNGK